VATVAEDRTRIDGPTPIHIRAIPGGAQLELDGLRRQIVEDALAALLSGEDTTLWDRLHEVAELTPETVARERERGRLPYEELVAELAERSSYRVTLYGRRPLLELARVLRTLAIRLPGQRRGGAAA
jgi:hypothetical protein